MIVIGSTFTTFVMDQKETWSSWVKNVDEIKKSHPQHIQYFAAIETDKRGLEPFNEFIETFNKIDGDYYTFSIDDRRTEITSNNRLRHICAGRNLIHEYAIEKHADHILFLDADIEPDPETLPKLLEMNHPLVGGQVPTYCLSGPKVEKYSFPVEEHMNTAGYLLAEHQVFNRIRWRWDWNLSDDPCFHRDAIDFLGIPTYVRKDVRGKHYPEVIGPIETRGHDMNVVR